MTTAARSLARARILPMRAEDIDAVMAIERHSYKSPWSRQIFLEELEREWARIDLLHVTGESPEVVGFVNYWIVRDEVHILNIAAHPSTRRRGHGARLLEHVIAVARRGQARLVTLEVRRSNRAAIRLYRKYGFRPVGIRPNYYEDREDAIVMLRDM